MSDDGDTPAPSRSPSPSRHSHDHNHNFHHHTHMHDHTSPHHQHRQSSYISAPTPPSFTQFPHMPALFTTPSRAAFTYEDAARQHQQNLANHHEMLRRHQQHMQQGMHGFGTPPALGPGLVPMPFMTMPSPPPPAVGLGNGVPIGGGGYSHSVIVSSAGGAGGDPVVRTSTSVRYGDNVVRPIPLARPAPQPATRGPGHTQDPGSLSSPTTVREQVTVSTPTSPSAPTPGPTPQASTRTPVYVHNSLPSPRSNGNTNTNVNVNINGYLFTSPGSTNTLGQAPADPHGVRTARLIHRPVSQDYVPTTIHGSAPRHSPSVLGGPRMGSFLQEHRSSQERMREARQITASARAYALARAQTATANANRTHNAAINAANLTETNRARLLLTHRINARRANTNTAAATATVPTAGPLLTILIASLKDCLGYDAVSTFAKSNYPHLTDKCYAKPRFLCMSTRQNTGPPSPLTMDAVMERLITQHISAEELERLEVPDWEGYMLLALELKWLETGMVVGAFGGDVVERIWEVGEDRGGTGRGGRYTEEDVRRRVEGGVWAEVERRFLRR